MDNLNTSSRFMSLPFMKPEVKKNKDDGKKELHLPGIGFLPNKARNHFIAGSGEFVGTFCFLFFAFSATQIANAAAAGASGGKISQVPNTSTLLYISLAFGFSLAVNAWIFYRISGGLFNPAVTLALALIGGVTWARAAIVLVAQLLGAMASAGVVAGLFPGEMAVSTSLGPGVSIAQGLFIEMFLTAELVFTICMLAAEKHKGTFLAPVGIGLSLFIAELSGVYWTGGSLNPARSFGPCVVLRSFPGYHWIYWLGPCLGALVAVGFYRFVKILEYETANPGQDFNEKEDSAFDFDEENAATGEDVERPDPTSVSLSRDAGQIPGVGGRVGSSGSGFMSEGRVGTGQSNYNDQTSMGGRPSTSQGDPNTPVMARGRPIPNLDGYDQPYKSGPAIEGGGGEPLGGRYRVQGL